MARVQTAPLILPSALKVNCRSHFNFQATVIPEEDSDKYKKFNLFNIQGLILAEDAFDHETIRKVLWYQARPDDVFLAAYPKSGTTLSQYIMWAILNDPYQPLPNFTDLSLKLFPFMEVSGVEAVEDLPAPRLMKHHLPAPFRHYHCQAKYVVIVRNPFDLCLSFFHHWMDMKPLVNYEGDFNDFFECFIRGEVPYGDYFDHVLSWYEHRNDKNVLFLYYEQLIEDKKSHILKIADFLGKEMGDRLRDDDDRLQKIVDVTDFESMKAAGEDTVENSDQDETQLKGYFRKGAIGDWKEYFSAEQTRRLDEVYKEKFGGTEMLKVWEKYLDL